MRKSIRINANCSKYRKIEYLYFQHSSGGGSAVRFICLVINHHSHSPQSKIPTICTSVKILNRE